MKEKIDTVELKIGNYIQDNYGNVSKIYQIEHRYKDVFRINDINDNKNIFPIKLTEEWLFKFGFEKKSWFTQGIVIECFYYQLNKFIVYLLPNSFEVEIINKAGDQFNLYKNWKYVHELQNIYFIFEREIN